MRLLPVGTYVLVAGFCLTSCPSNSELPPDIQRLGRANAPPLSDRVAPPAEPPSEPSATVHRGVVAEVLDVPHYTYLRLRTSGGEETWAAIPSTKLEVGQSVEVVQSLIMTDFFSKTLNRTFPSIVFGVLPGPGSQAGLPQSHPSMAAPGAVLPPGHPPIDASKAGKNAPASGSES